MTLIAMGQALGVMKEEKSDGKKTGRARTKLESGDTSAPDLIPDDIFFMNFDCSRAGAKRGKVKRGKHKML